MIFICIILGIIALGESIFILWVVKWNDEERTIGDKINFFRNLWGKFLFYVLATSIIGLFLGSVYFKKVIGLDVINTWVGIVLGLVALIIGIISLFLSFYNVDQANKTQEKTIEIITNLQRDIERKIDENYEKTRQEIKGNYNNSTANFRNYNSESSQWEDNNE
ncbi:hypothetical protein C818_04214 [Lachnospiraceae bacterium MD308]|nr:hypothetical protein C818_04214 [Lachnospiraceae bacterium MD308]